MGFSTVKIRSTIQISIRRTITRMAAAGVVSISSIVVYTIVVREGL
jgi:hypothetical protein